MLVARGADPLAINDKGCGVSHWAAGGSGDARLCTWLRDDCGVSFEKRILFVCHILTEMRFLFC